MGQVSYTNCKVASPLSFVHFDQRICKCAQMLSCSHLVNHKYIPLVFHMNLIDQKTFFLREGTQNYGIFMCTSSFKWYNLKYGGFSCRFAYLPYFKIIWCISLSLKNLSMKFLNRLGKEGKLGNNDQTFGVGNSWYTYIPPKTCTSLLICRKVCAEMPILFVYFVSWVIDEWPFVFFACMCVQLGTLDLTYEGSNGSLIKETPYKGCIPWREFWDTFLGVATLFPNSNVQSPTLKLVATKQHFILGSTNCNIVATNL